MCCFLVYFVLGNISIIKVVFLRSVLQQSQGRFATRPAGSFRSLSAQLVGEGPVVLLPGKGFSSWPQRHL